MKGKEMDDVSWKEYVDEKFLAQEKSLNAALSAIDNANMLSEKAIDKAEADNRKWREVNNEWRAAMKDRESTFLTRKEFYAMLGAAVAAISISRFIAN